MGQGVYLPLFRAIGFNNHIHHTLAMFGMQLDLVSFYIDFLQWRQDLQCRRRAFLLSREWVMSPTRDAYRTVRCEALEAHSPSCALGAGCKDPGMAGHRGSPCILGVWLSLTGTLPRASHPGLLDPTLVTVSRGDFEVAPVSPSTIPLGVVRCVLAAPQPPPTGPWESCWGSSVIFSTVRRRARGGITDGRPSASGADRGRASSI